MTQAIFEVHGICDMPMEYAGLGIKRVKGELTTNIYAHSVNAEK